MPHPALRAIELTKRFGEVLAVDRLTLEVRPGEILGFLGPNGAGKTTSLRMMCGLLRPDDGRIEIDGEALRAGASAGQRSLGVAPQNIVLWDTLTCREQLEFMGHMYDLPRAKARARAEQLLEAFGLTEKTHRLGKTLSGGMQRRLNIALALVHEPKLLFLDEPQAGLDPQSRVLVRDYLASLRGQMTVIITTHDMEEAEKLADRVCIIDHGRVLVMDTVSALKRQLGDDDLFEVEVDPSAGLGTDPLGSAQEKNREALSEIAAASKATLLPDGRSLLLSAADGAGQLAEVLRTLGARGLRARSVRTRQATLEDLFIRLTGRRLRE